MTDTPGGDGSDTPDLSTLPTFVLPSPDEFMAQEGTVNPLVGFDPGTLTESDLGWPFCLLFNGQAWQTMTWQTDSPAVAAGAMDAFTQWLNAQLVQQGYPPNICTWAVGACPSASVS